MHYYNCHSPYQRYDCPLGHPECLGLFIDIQNYIDKKLLLHRLKCIEHMEDDLTDPTTPTPEDLMEDPLTGDDTK